MLEGPEADSVDPGSSGEATKLISAPIPCEAVRLSRTANKERQNRNIRLQNKNFLFIGTG
jgi:hypothetical protein